MNVIRNNEGEQPKLRKLDIPTLKVVLMDISEKEQGTVQMLSSCSSMYNTIGETVLLSPGDNFSIANSICPAGTLFYVLSGTHTQQVVDYSRDGNSWVGTGTAIMDGQNSMARAFQQGMKNNNISWIQIKRYTEYGIFYNSGNSSNVEISNMTFKNIASNKSGQSNSAILFEFSSNIIVRDSYFENVTSSVRFKFCDGPLKVLDNEALNTGRNFFQCNKCEGGNIRINGNSIEHSSKYGPDKLVDFISIFQSEGLMTDYIQVNNNRARINNVSGVDSNGSFIILGDEGGKFQKAEDNIGVTTGNVGIGAAGGIDIEVKNNIMYSPQTTISNVAFYSNKYPENHPAQCGGHIFAGNIANWKNSSGNYNKAHAPSSDQHIAYCGLTNTQIRADSRVFENRSINSDIWDQW